ncbi:MAG TPA: hypothetical protein VGF29_21020 [Hyphomicrobiaceae bacterium]
MASREQTDPFSAEIKSWLDRLADEGQPWRADWIANAICVSHEAGLADCQDAHFWRHYTLGAVRDQVRRVMNKRAGPAADGEETPRLPGFEHLQMYYLVKRGDEEVGVHVRDLTDAELDEKAALLRAMGTTCFAHAQEIERFKLGRAGKGRAAGAA